MARDVTSGYHALVINVLKRAVRDRDVHFLLSDRGYAMAFFVGVTDPGRWKQCVVNLCFRKGEDEDDFSAESDCRIGQSSGRVGYSVKSGR